MERPPNMTFAQVSALYGDSSLEEQRQELLAMTPISYINKFENSSDRSQAQMVVSENSAFREDDFVEGGKMFNGRIQYPFTSTAELWTGKTDPYYFDGSEVNNVYHLQENLIGRPLGADFIRDPNYTYIENLIKMKEAKSQRDVIDDDYVKKLYLFNSEKGTNYYTTAVEKEFENLASQTREGRSRKQRTVYVESIENDITSQGQFEHPGQIESKQDYFPSQNAYQQSNSRQSRFDRVERRNRSLYDPRSFPRELIAEAEERNRLGEMDLDTDLR